MVLPSSSVTNVIIVDVFFGHCASYCRHPVIGNSITQTKYLYKEEIAQRPHPPEQPRQAWRNSESPMMHHFPSGKPPLPPVSPAIGAETHRTMDTNKTKKSDKITEEW